MSNIAESIPHIQARLKVEEAIAHAEVRNDKLGEEPIHHFAKPRDISAKLPAECSLAASFPGKVHKA